jgi:hypothetical protein
MPDTLGTAYRLSLIVITHHLTLNALSARHYSFILFHGDCVSKVSSTLGFVFRGLRGFSRFTLYDSEGLHGELW